MELLISLLPLATFAFVTSATPGPNNILLTASGIQFGFVRTLPHIMGIQLGVTLQLVLCSLGLGLSLMAIPGVADGIRIAGTIYLLYLAWQLRHTSMLHSDSTAGPPRAKPFTVIQAMLFQFINPKAWIMTMTAGSLFAPVMESRLTSVLLLCLTFCLVATPSTGSWALIGSAVKRYLRQPRGQQTFSGLMVILTVYSATTLWIAPDTSGPMPIN